MGAEMGLARDLVRFQVFVPNLFLVVYFLFCRMLFLLRVRFLGCFSAFDCLLDVRGKEKVRGFGAFFVVDPGATVSVFPFARLSVCLRFT